MKKLLSVLLAISMIVAAVALTACSGKESDNKNNTTDTKPSTADSTGKNDADSNKKKTLTMATNAQFPPYEFYDGENIVGIDAEVAKAIADKLDMELVIDDMNFESILPAVQSGKADMGMAGMTVKPDRLESVNFSDSYAKGVQVIIVKEDSSIASPDDLAGKKIGVQLSTTGDAYASEDFGDENVEKYSSGAEAVLALSQGKIDAVIIDNEPAKSFVKGTEGLKILDTKYADEDYAICFAKDNTELMEKVNGVLKELIADGTFKKIIDKYIPAE